MAATSADQMNAITRAQFEDAIARAVNNRSRIYNNSFALSFRWEQDKTNSSTDTDHFQAILSTLNLDQAEVEILAEQDQTPGWTLNDKIRLSRRSINLQRIIDNVVAGDVQDFDIADTDAVFVLDCCYSHVATRALNPTTRVVEILAASDDHNPEAFTPPRNTLTGKLRGEIARRKRDGHHCVVLSDVMATIRGNSPVVKPTHHVKLGVSVCFPFAGVTYINPNTIAPSLRAVFSVRIVENINREQLNRFITWIEALPPGFAIELEGVYTTTSTLLIFQSAYALFKNLAGYPGVTLISDVTSPNRRKYLGQEQQQGAPSSTLKENVPYLQTSKP
ncbi:hypothetical protein ABOM_000159 [Aspergillus bombycis]|uniref:Uncharacterized protein n=1 Tax=Aspergillus bombycis TaxID=109264 RepID=A0A1F8AHB6_9EURO|nr:hypothetical protein ABOM_000159 [Aspergillus bombycis]OGM51126.1 hypothetical protein ABOM_000159 [Aspergillus bombycis]